MGMSAPLYYTAEMVRALPEDGNRYDWGPGGAPDPISRAAAHTLGQGRSRPVIAKIDDRPGRAYRYGVTRIRLGASVPVTAKL